MNEYRNRVVELESGGVGDPNPNGASGGNVDNFDSKGNATIVARQAQTIRELRARVDALESASAAAEVMMQMPSVDELMVCILGC